MGQRESKASTVNAALVDRYWYFTTGSHSQLTSSDRFYLEVLRAQRVVSALEVEEQALAELLAGESGEEVCEIQMSAFSI